MSKFFPPFLWIVAFQIIGGAIGFVTSGNIEWYNSLKQSLLTPPDAAFGIVWSILYVMLALAGWRVSKVRENSPVIYRLFWVQMILNWGWSFVFFQFHNVEMGFTWIVALNIVMVVLIVKAWAVDRVISLLVLPTLVWGSFAGYLNYAIITLN